MQYTLCRHIKTNGLQCQSPALRQQDLCFFHSRLHQRHAPFRSPVAPQPQPAGLERAGDGIALAPLEDRESVQVALSVVINALASGQLEIRRATAILYGLQLASNNAARLASQPSPSHLIATSPATAAGPDLDGLDLAEPGAQGILPSWADFEDSPDSGSSAGTLHTPAENDADVNELRPSLDARLELFRTLGHPAFSPHPDR